MKRMLGRFISLFVILLLLIVLLTSVVSAEKYTVANTKDWRSIYLLSIYGSYTNSSVVFFKNLADAQLKTKLMGLDDEIVVFESTVDPVIKNYRSLLKVNGYTTYDSLSFNNYIDLQELLANQLDLNGYFVMDSDFGLNAVAGTTFMLSRNYFPLFVDETNVDSVVELTKDKENYVVGRTPVRILDRLEGQKIQGFSHETLRQTVELSIDEIDTDWGVIMRIDTIDLKLLTKGLPIFVYHAKEYLDEVAKIVKNSDIAKFEVVGAGTADIAKAIELQSQKNLNFMLKYGRKITNYPGLEDDILDVDSVAFAYPVESLIIVDTVYYPEMDILALTFENTGNVDVLFFSNVEFAGEPLSDENTHSISSGEQKTIPFKLSQSGLEGDQVRVTTRYGASLPLKFAISGEKGTIYYESEVRTNYLFQDEYILDLISSGFDTERGVLEVVFKNPYDESLFLFSELLIDESDVSSSKVVEIGPKEKKTLFIETPYLRDEDVLLKEFPLITYLGLEDTISVMNSTLIVEEKPEFKNLIIMAVVVVLLIAGLLFFLVRRRKDDDKSNKKSSSRDKPKLKSKSKPKKKKR